MFTFNLPDGTASRFTHCWLYRDELMKGGNLKLVMG